MLLFVFYLQYVGWLVKKATPSLWWNWWSVLFRVLYVFLMLKYYWIYAWQFFGIIVYIVFSLLRMVYRTIFDNQDVCNLPFLFCWCELLVLYLINHWWIHCRESFLGYLYEIMDAMQTYCDNRFTVYVSVNFFAVA